MEKETVRAKARGPIRDQDRCPSNLRYSSARDYSTEIEKLALTVS